MRPHRPSHDALRPRARRFASALALALLAAACVPLTVEEERELGHEAQRQVRQSMELMRDPEVVGFVRQVGARVVAASDPSPFEFRFYVVEDEALNAFAVPGGAIYVHCGMLLGVDDSAELAGVLAHEVAHVTARHVANLYRRGRNVGIAAKVFAALVAVLTGSGELGQVGELAAGVAATAYMATFSQEAELEADRRAIAALIGAGYDPHAMIHLFETLQREHEGRSVPRFLSSHPATAERIAQARAEIVARGPLPPPRRTDTGALEIIQARIRLVIGVDEPSQAG